VRTRTGYREASGVAQGLAALEAYRNDIADAAPPLRRLAAKSERWHSVGKGGDMRVLARVSNKGQVTVPASARRRLGIEPNSQVEVTVTDQEITIRPIKRMSELAGILSRYARSDAPGDWDAIRDETERAVAEEVVSASDRRLRGGR
jgi:AbrB family looped-hinge helix DNA binding protein